MLLVFFLIYLALAGRWAAIILDRVFDLKNSFSKFLLGTFAAFASLGTVAGVVILFYPLTFLTQIAIFIGNALVYFLLSKYVKKTTPQLVNSVSEKEVNQSIDLLTKIGSALFVCLAACGFYLLYSSQTGNAILTPWQVIKPQYIFIFLASTFVLALLTFSKLKSGIVIFFLILQTFLLHSYVPLTHELIYGADGWRHMANEQRIVDGKKFLEPAIIDASSSNSVQSVIGQLSYGNFWTSNVIVAKVFNTDLLTVTKWLLPILWSMLMPVLLFEIGRAFDWTERKSLFLAWLGLLPFAWQAGGAFTLPVSFGFLIWLLLVLLILKRLRNPNRSQMFILAGAGMSLISGYILYFILFWLVWFVVEVLIYLSSRATKGGVEIPQDGGANTGLLRRIRLLAMTCCAMIFIPTVELFAGYSSFDKQINWLGQIKQFVGNFLGVYIANGPRPHDIPFGNIIFNQVPAYAFIPNLLTEWRWWVPVFMVGFFSLTIWGWIRMLKLNTAYGDWLAIISGGVIGGYVISNYFFAGPHILTRRLDAVVAFFLILLFAYGLYSLIAVIKRQPMVRKFRSVPFIIHTGGILLLSVVVTAVYSLGPDTKTVSFSEYGLMQYIWEVESWYKKPRLPYCVLADTYPLLALEAISAKEIIGGNFPIDASFGQPELNRIYYNMLHDINITDPRDVQLLNDFIECWYIDPVKEWPGRFNQIAKFFDLSHDAEFKILGTLEANKFWK